MPELKPIESGYYKFWLIILFGLAGICGWIVFPLIHNHPNGTFYLFINIVIVFIGSIVAYFELKSEPKDITWHDQIQEITNEPIYDSNGKVINNKTQKDLTG